MKKIILVSFIAFSLLFIQNVNAAVLETSCVSGTDNELNQFVKSNIDMINLKTANKYEYITYCTLKSYDFSSEHTSNVDYAQGCLFNTNDDLSDSVLVNCSLYFTIVKTPYNQFYFNFRGNGSGYIFNGSYKEIFYSIKEKQVISSGGSNVEISSNYEDLIKAILMILVTILFLIFVLKIMGV